jgi:hypothetical protein
VVKITDMSQREKTSQETGKHREAFEVWYSQNRSFVLTVPKVSASDRTLRNWASAFEWHQRADERDARAQVIADEAAARERAERQIKRRQAGELLAEKGRAFFAEEGIDNARDAMQAIKIGTEIERKEDGVPDWVLLILNANSNELEQMGKRLGSAFAAGATAGEGDDSLAFAANDEDD